MANFKFLKKLIIIIFLLYTNFIFIKIQKIYSVEYLSKEKKYQKIETDKENDSIQEKEDIIIELNDEEILEEKIISENELEELKAELKEEIIAEEKFEATEKDAKKAHDKLKLVNLGILKVENLKIETTQKGKFQVSADIILFGLKSKLSLLSLNPLLFSLKLPKPVEIPITPWKKVPFQIFKLKITDKKKELFVRTNIFGPKDIKISFNLAKKKNYAQIKLKNFKLSSIINELKDSIFDKITPSYVKIKISNFLYPKKPHPVKLIGKVDFIKLNLPLPQNITLDKLKASVKFEKKSGVILKAKIKTIDIPDLAKIKKPKLILLIPTKKQKTKNGKSTKLDLPTLILEGDADITIPFIKKSISTEAKAIFQPPTKKEKIGKFTFQTSISAPLNFKNIIKFKQFDFYFSTDGTALISGTSKILENFFDLEIIATLKISRQKKIDIEKVKEKSPTFLDEEILKKQGKVPKKFVVELEGQTDKPFNPFAKITCPVSFLKDINVEKVKVALTTEKKLLIKGKSKILNIETEIEIIAKPKNQIIIKASLPTGWKISQSIPEAKPLDFLNIEKASFIITTHPYFDKQIKMNINKGLTIFAITKMDDPNLNKIKSILEGMPDSLGLFASIGPTLTNISIIAKVPMDLRLPIPKQFINKFSLSDVNINIGIEGAKPKMFLAGQVKIQLTPKDEDLIFTGKIGVEFVPEPSLVMEESMEGMWKNPFGIRGLSIGNLAIALGITVQPIATPPFVVPKPTKIGLTGTVELFDKKIKVAGQYSQAGDIVINGELKGELVPSDLLTIPIQFAKNIEEDITKEITSIAETIKRKKVDIKSKLLVKPKDLENAKEDVKTLFKIIGFDNIKIKDIKIYLAPKTTKIGEIRFDPGFTLQGQLFFKGKEEAAIYTNLDSTGFVLKGHIPKIKIGPLLISSYSPDKKIKPKYDGPMVDMTVRPPLDFHLKLNGMIDIAGIGGHGYANVGLDRINYDYEAKIINIFNVKISGKTEGDILHPKTLAFIGNAEMNIGDAKAFAELKIKKFPYLIGYMKKLTLHNILKIPQKAGIKIPTKIITKIIPNTGFKDVIFILASHSGKIEGINVQPGLSLKALMYFLNSKINIEGMINKKGIIFKEKTKGTLFLGPLKVHNSQIDLTLTEKDQHFLISGDTTFFGKRNRTLIKTVENKIIFDTKSKFLNQFETALHGESFGNIRYPKTIDFKLVGYLKNDFFRHIEQLSLTTEKLILREMKKTKKKRPRNIFQAAWNKMIDAGQIAVKTVSTITRLAAPPFVIEKASFQTSLKALQKGTLPLLKIRIKLYRKTYELRNIQVHLTRPDITFKNIIKTIHNMIIPIKKKRKK